MDKRTKILAGAFGVVVAYVLIANVVFPSWIAPVLNIDERIAARRNEYQTLKALEDEVDDAREVYKDMVARVGAFDVNKVTTDIRARLNRLIEKHDLFDANVTPSRPTEDRKTGVGSFQITISAVGSLKSVVEFIRDAAELPQLVRMGNASLYPARRARRHGGETLMNIRLPIEVLVLPQKRLVGKMEPESLEQPQQIVRHYGRDYSVIWEGKPFSEPIPLRVVTRGDARVKVGDEVPLTASASGGEPPYRYRWSPSTRLDDPTSERPKVDTSSAMDETYTVTVTDAKGETATSKVRVFVIEPIPSRVTRRPEEPKKPPGPQRWADGRYRQVRMTLLRAANGHHLSELMLYNNRSKESEYFAVGDAFDGGELMMVHPRGGIVRRSGEYFLYPIGGWVDRDVPVSDESAEQHPDLTAAARRLQATDSAAKDEQAAARPAAAKPDAVDAPAKGPPAEGRAASSDPEPARRPGTTRTGGVSRPGRSGRITPANLRELRRRMLQHRQEEPPAETAPDKDAQDGKKTPGPAKPSAQRTGDAGGTDGARRPARPTAKSSRAKSRAKR